MIENSNNLIDVVVPVLDRPKETFLTVEALLKANDDIRVILIHDGSTEKVNLDILATDRIVEKDTNARLGHSKALNFGLDLVKSDYVVTMHGDVVVHDKNWVRKAVKFLKENRDVGLIGAVGVSKERRLVTTLKNVHDRRWKLLIPEEDFTEVVFTDNMVNVFKNIGVRSDERVGLGGVTIWVDFKAMKLKLCVIKFDDAAHLPGSTRTLEVYTKVRPHQEGLKIYRSVLGKRLKELTGKSDVFEV